MKLGTTQRAPSSLLVCAAFRRVWCPLKTRPTYPTHSPTPYTVMSSPRASSSLSSFACSCKSVDGSEEIS
ncbi:hypothetical protein E2C01_080517 [Portunus trituberculatus]|uniref:Uncharacterized protein n=1 Tax=Portunus trituberculatus TaxID=210409 RepID=A0A5B7IUA2_PORTR|nr:hypothetical protein [Portunus trituberculatus]